MMFAWLAILVGAAVGGFAVINESNAGGLIICGVLFIAAMATALYLVALGIMVAV